MTRAPSSTTPFGERFDDDVTSPVLRVIQAKSVNLNAALSQAIAVSQTIVRRRPNGTTPPLILRISPSSVPIVQLVMSSDALSSGELSDYVRVSEAARDRRSLYPSRARVGEPEAFDPLGAPDIAA